MTKAELLESLAAKAAELGIDPPSQTKLESWISKGLLIGAQAKGRRRGVAPVWSYDAQTVAAALKIVELQARGATRTAQLCLGLAVEGFPLKVDFVRTNLKKEYVRVLKRMRRDGWRNFKDGGTPTPSELRQSAGVDSALVATGMTLSPDAMFTAISEAITGEDKGLNKSAEIDAVVAQVAQVLIPDLTRADAQRVMMESPSLNLFARGSIGLPDETDQSLVQIISDASDDDIKTALQFYGLCKVCLEQIFAGTVGMDTDHGAKLSRTIRSVEWLPILLGIMVPIASFLELSD